MRHHPRAQATVLLSLLLLAPAVGFAVPAEPVRIGVVVDGPWLGNDEIRRLNIQEVLALTRGEMEVRFPQEHYLIGDWTLETARAHLDRLLADPEVDLVITWGILASHAVCCYVDLPKPVIAPVVLDADLQGLPRANGASGVPNLSYVALPDNLARELEIFRRVVPFDKVALMVNRAFMEAIPELYTRTRQAVRDAGLEFDYIPVGDSAAEALEAIPTDAEAVYVFPLFHLSPEEFGRLVEGFRQRRLPSFSALGGSEVDAGMLATAGAEDFLPRLVRRVALNVQRILLGEDAGEIPVGFTSRPHLAINMATARAIDVSPRWEALVEARLLHAEEVEGRRGESLAHVVERAVAANLDLEARRLGVVAGEEEMARARAAFFPRLEASAQGVRIDEDRAAASFGSQPEHAVTAGVTLSQLLYSDAARANLVVQRELQRGRRYDLEQLRLDIALAAATTYLDLLRAKSLERIQRNNLELTRENLELARVRRFVGSANPAEVYRWESQIAIDRKALIEATARRQAAEIALNRLLHYEQEEPFVTVEVGLEDPALLSSEDRLRRYIDTPKHFRVFRDFTVQEGLTAAPELRRLRAAITAQERAALAAERAFWAPTVAARATLEERLAEAGAGSGGGAPLPPPLAFESPDDTSWSLALSFSLPLFTGGERRADLAQARAELERLELEWSAVAEKVEQRVRSAMVAARASFTGIELARQAAVAAGENLELVSDAYARGALSILELLDAQNAALNAELRAADAVYDFLIDLMEVERAANRFNFFTSPEERDTWFERLDRFFAESGVEPAEP